MQAHSQSATGSEPLTAYCTASIPDPYRILGLRLRPFSLGHYLLMQRFGCNFLADDVSTATREDLILGVLICSMRHAEFLVFIEQKNFAKEMVAWGKRIGLFDFPEKSGLFQKYLRASLDEPDYIELHPSQGGSGDWAQNLKLVLVTKLFYTEADALDMPLSKALADYYKLAESEGAVRLITKEDRAHADANAAAMDAFAASSQTTEAPWPA